MCVLLTLFGLHAAASAQNLFDEAVAASAALNKQWTEVNFTSGGETLSRVNSWACTLGDAAYFFGGESLPEEDLLGDFCKVNFSTLEVTELVADGEAPPKREKHKLVCDAGRGVVYLVGGKKVEDLWVYHPQNNTWRELPHDPVNGLTYDIFKTDFAALDTTDIIVVAGTVNAEFSDYARFDKRTEQWLPREHEPRVRVEDPGGIAFGELAVLAGGITTGSILPPRTFVLNTSSEVPLWEDLVTDGMAGEEFKMTHLGDGILALIGDPGGKGELAGNNGIALLDMKAPPPLHWTVVNRTEDWAPRVSDLMALDYKGMLVVLGGGLEGDGSTKIMGSTAMLIFNPAVCPAGCNGNGDCVLGNCVNCRGHHGLTCEIPYPVTEEDLTLVYVLAVGAPLLVVTVAAAVGLQMFQKAVRKKKTQYAPKNADEPCAFVFTDIQRSSELWNAYPDEMEEALKTHHHILRELIEEYHGYEVKTIGDAFMVAFSDSAKAADFLCRMQIRLLDQEWPVRMQENPSCKYEEGKFNGLRVRAGAHFGKANPCETPQGGYDYDGHAVNLASRVSDSGCGGQILVTEAFYTEVEPHMDDLSSNVEMRLLGEYHFRGITEEVGVLELVPEELKGRSFGELRNATAVVVAETFTDATRSDNRSYASSASGVWEDFGARREFIHAAQELRSYFMTHYDGVVPVLHMSVMLLSVIEPGDTRVMASVLKLGIVGKIKGVQDSGPDKAGRHHLAEVMHTVGEKSGRGLNYSVRWGAIVEILRSLPPGAVGQLSAKLARNDLGYGTEKVTAVRAGAVPDQPPTPPPRRMVVNVDEPNTPSPRRRKGKAEFPKGVSPRSVPPGGPISPKQR